MSDNSEVLTLLLSREKEALGRAQAELGAARERWQHAQQQADQLQAYRLEFERHWLDQFSRSTQMQLMNCYRQFNTRLDSALNQQNHTVEHVKGLAEQAQSRLVLQEIKVASLEKLLERMAARVKDQQARREQRETDEWSQASLMRAKAT